MDLDAWLAYQLRLHPKSIAMGLERIRPVAERMRVLQAAARVVTVGGTNGKGSTVAMIEAAALAAGLRVGAYTSPHIERYNERIRINGRDVDDASLIAAFEAVEAARGESALTFFEFGTLAALFLFSRAALDLAVLEVGLGGRLDAVNLVDADIAIVTTVALDHMDWLGPTRDHIGFEKAGIFRAGRPALVGELEPPPRLLECAAELGADLQRRGTHFDIERQPDGLRYRDDQGEMELPPLRMVAPAQADNAAVATRALRLLGIPAQAIAKGIGDAALRGRLQRLEGQPEIILDVGHNPQAADQIARFLASDPRPTHAVFAALADKDIETLAGILGPDIVEWHLAGLEVAGRSMDAETLAGRVRAGYPEAQIETSATVADAVQAALNSCDPHQRVLVFGSFHTVGEALTALRQAGRLRE